MTVTTMLTEVSSKIDINSREHFGSRYQWIIGLIIFAVGLTVRMIPVLRGGGFFTSISYDGSVYYAASAGLAHGLWPYRDFLLLHPPGITVALLPFSMIGRWLGDPLGMAPARVGFIALGAANAGLVALVLRRQGLLAACAGGLFYAVFFPAVFSERSVSLEAVATALTLGGLALSVSRRSWPPTAAALVASGALVGLSAGVKIWGVAVLVAVGLWCWRTWGGRAAATFAAGGLGALTLLCLPFFLTAPGAMWRMVVLDQLGRARSANGAYARLVDVLGLNLFGVVGVGASVTLIATGVAMVLVVAALIVSLRSPIGQLSVALLLTCTAILVATPAWFVHYSALTAGPLALLVGCGVGWLATQRLFVLARIGVAGLCVCVILSGWACTRARFGRTVDVGPLVAAAAGRHGCVTADDPTALILTDLMRRNLHRGCRLVVDLGGYSYDLPRTGAATKRSENLAWQQLALSYLREGDTAMIMRFRKGQGFNRASAREVTRWRLVADVPGVRMVEPAGSVR